MTGREGRKRSCPTLRYYISMLLGELRENHETHPPQSRCFLEQIKQESLEQKPCKHLKQTAT